MSLATETGDCADAEPPPASAPAPSRKPALHLDLDIQHACESAGLPDDAELGTCIQAAILAAGRVPPNSAVLTLRIVDSDEGRELNERYRGRNGPTNVLSFPFEPPPGLPPEALGAGGEVPLGDIVVCAPVLRREAQLQAKSLAAHSAHLVIHGTLHLLGFDHIDPADASEMEALESTILAGLGFAPPYEVPEEPDDE